MNIYTNASFFTSAEIYNNGTQVWSYSVGDTLTIKLLGVDPSYKSAFQGIAFLTEDGTTELAYTATSEGWNSEDNTEYDMTFTVPDTFNDNIRLTTKFDTTNMYDIDFNAAYASGLVNPTYTYASIDKNFIKKALPGTTVTLKIDVTLLDAETELALDNWSGLSGISASDFGAWTVYFHSSTTLIMQCTFTMPSNNVAMTANFKDASAAVTHTVTFKNGLVTVDTVTVEEGTAIPSADIPTVVPPTGMKFDYWADENNNEFDFDTLITADITLFAKFKAITYTVTFNSNGGSEVPSQEVNYGAKATKPEDPTKTGAEFVNWYSDETLETVYDFDTVVSADIILYAGWENLQNTVTFKEGDETIATVKVDDKQRVKPIEPLHSTDASGNEFVYWALNNVEYDFTTPVDNDITLVAVYAKAGSSKWIMSLPNCYVGLKSDVADLPKARVANGTKALAISANAGEETAYIFHRASLTWIELQHYTVMI